MKGDANGSSIELLSSRSTAKSTTFTIMLQKLYNAHTAACIVIGLLLIWNPEFIPFTEGHLEAIHVSKLFGIMAFIFGLVCYHVGKDYRETELMRKVHLSIIALYLMSGLYLIGLYRQGVMELPVAGSACLVYGGLVVIAYMNEVVGKR